LTADPGWLVQLGDQVKLTQEVKNASDTSSGSWKCSVAKDALVDGGANMQIFAVTLGDDGPGKTCGDLKDEKKYCSLGKPNTEACTTNTDCDTVSGAGDGTCTAVTTTKLADKQNNDIDGELTYTFTPSQTGTFGIGAKYEGGNNYNNAAKVCENLAVEKQTCSGATIVVERVEGDGAPDSGSTKTWKIDVTVHACEYLYDVSAQGGANGWAPLKDRSLASLDPDTGVAAIRKANNKNDVVLWTIGNMAAGTTAKLTMTLEGSVPRSAPDCQQRFLTGPWSALFSTDGLNVQKTDYAGRVWVNVDANGDDNPEGTCQ
jgi:hypothetical protein